MNFGFHPFQNCDLIVMSCSRSYLKRRNSSIHKGIPNQLTQSTSGFRWLLYIKSKNEQKLGINLFKHESDYRYCWTQFQEALLYNYSCAFRLMCCIKNLPTHVVDDDDGIVSGVPSIQSLERWYLIYVEMTESREI